jgi:hypothetical protein
MQQGYVSPMIYRNATKSFQELSIPAFRKISLKSRMQLHPDQNLSEMVVT